MKKVELVTNLVVIAVGVAVLFFFARNYYADRNAPQSLPQVKVGDQLPALPQVSWRDNDRTLLLVIRKGCHYCEDSMPFYRHLSQMAERGELNAHLVAVLPDSPSDARDLLENQQISIATVPDFPLKELNVAGTPTVILADNAGRVLDVWSGELAPKNEDSLIESLKSSNRHTGTATPAPLGVPQASRLYGD